MSSHPPSPLDLADRLHSVAIHLLRRLRREDNAAGLPAPQLSALSVIVFAGPITLGALAQAEQVRPPTITKLIATLEAKALVTREPDPHDGRVTLVRATARGAKLLQEGRERRVAALAAELKKLSREDRRDVGRAVTVLEGIVRGKAENATRKGDA